MEENERTEGQLEGGRVEADDLGLNSDCRRKRKDQDIDSAQPP